MIEPSKTAAASRQQAEKPTRPQPRPQSTYAHELAILDEQRRAEDKKTARLRALRLAKEEATAKEEAEAKERTELAGAKRRKRRAPAAPT
jgi:hypothetical protein